MPSVRLSSAARESLQTLREENRGVVLAAIGRLTEGAIPPGLPRPYRLQNRPDLTVLSAGRYRIAYAETDDGNGDEVITVVDIVAHDLARESAQVPAIT